MQMLETRLARIEAMLQIEREQPPVEPRSVTGEGVVGRSEAVPEPQVGRPEVAPPPIVDPPGQAKAAQLDRLKADWERLGDDVTAAAPAEAPIAPPTAPPPAPAPPRPRAASHVRPKREPLSFEQIIGGKAAAWVGALVVVLGAGFGIAHFGADFWGALSPLAKCAVIAGFGGLLIAGGEFVLRKVGPVASVGLYASGIATLYLDAYSSFTAFAQPLFSREITFVLMGLVAMLGFGLTLRTRFRTIAVLSLIAGFCVPLLLRGGGTHHLEVLSYLTLLLGIALGLSASWHRSFRSLRFVALGGLTIVGGLWMAQYGQQQLMLALLFLSTWWAMAMAESVLAALREQSAIGNIVMVVLSTAAYVMVGCLILHGTPSPGPEWLGAYTAMIAALSLATGFQFGPGIDALRQRLRTAMEKLAVTLWLMGGALVGIAIALQFDDVGRPIGWLVFALACVEAGRHLPSKGVSYFGFAVLLLAVFDLWVVTPLVGNTTRALWTRGPVEGSVWMYVMLGGIAVTLACAHRWLRSLRPSRHVMPTLLATLAALCWLGLCIAQCENGAITAGWLLAALALLLAAPFGGRQRYLRLAEVVVVCGIGRWLVFDLLGPRVTSGWDAMSQTPFLSWSMVLAAGLVVMGAFACWRELDTGAAPSTAFGRTLRGMFSEHAFTIVAGLVLLLGASLEVDRLIAQMDALRRSFDDWHSTHLRLLWWTLLWGAGGGGLVALAAWRGHELVRLAGWTILLLATAAWLSADTLSARLLHGEWDGAIVFNLPFLVGAALAGLLGLACWELLRDWSEIDDRQRVGVRRLLGVGLSSIALIIIWLGSLEIDRFFTGDAMKIHTGLSIYWAMCGVALVVIGFFRRAAPARYGGLLLLAVTLVKFFLVDLAEVALVYKFLSAIGVGLLLIGTSILYVRLAPKLRESTDDESEEPTGV